MKTPAAMVVSLAVLAILCLGAATAGERRTRELVLRDGAGDVWTTPIGGDSYTPAPDLRVGDVLRVRLVHGERTIRARARYVDLRRSGHQQLDLAVQTHAGTWYADVASAPEDRAGRHHLWQQSGDAVPCAAMSHRIDYRTETVAVQIPRRCLGTPGWVRVVVNNIHETTSRLAEDNPHSDQPFPHEPTRRLFAP